MYKIHYIELPAGVDGVTVANDGVYDVYINLRQNRFCQCRALGHELAHIYLGHFDIDGAPAPDAEQAADAHAWQYYERFLYNGLLSLFGKEGLQHGGTANS